MNAAPTPAAFGSGAVVVRRDDHECDVRRGRVFYYTNSVATGDVQRQPGTAMTDYYAVDGNPPGVWMGGAAALVGCFG